MNVKTTIPISEARKRIFEIANEVQRPSKYYTLTDRGRPKAVIMGAEEFESWQESFEVARDFSDLKKDVEEAEKEYKSGKYKNWTTLDDLMKQGGFVAADQPKKKYGIPAKDKAQRGKKA